MVTANEKRQIFDDLKRLQGYPPYDESTNYVAHDGHFANSLEVKYGMSLYELGKAVEFDKRVNKWYKAKKLADTLLDNPWNKFFR